MLANASQEEALRKNNVAISNTDEAYHRKLVAYYRPTQLEYISRVQICEIMRFLKYYVEQ